MVALTQTHTRLVTRARAHADVATLAWLRIVYGALVCFASVRFLANGWVAAFYVEPTFHFHYRGLAWIQVLPPFWMHAAFGLMAVCGLLVLLGWMHRVALTTFLAVFTYVEYIDVTYYLNHYYLVCLIGALLLVLPAHRAWSVDARRGSVAPLTTVPAWWVWLLRFQVGVVYVFAAVAKAQPDWLIHGQPMNIWLNSRVDFPVMGGLFVLYETALVFSWAGFLYDATIVGFLLHRRTRTLAYIAVLAFHGLTGALFNIGMFPLLMIGFTTVFFDGATHRRWLRKLGREPDTLAHAKTTSLATVAALIWVAFHVFFPLRTFVHGGNVLWHEEGMRWSWRVMVREKNASVTYRVVLPDEDRETWVSPHRYLTAYQEREFGGQPDLIVQLGRHIGQAFREEGHAHVEVYADAIASLNGRPAERLIDPNVDLMTVRLGTSIHAWIEPSPETCPPRLDPVARPSVSSVSSVSEPASR